MSGPLLLIGFPLAMAPVVYALGRRPARQAAAALAVAALLSLVVLRLPMGEPLDALGIDFSLDRSMFVLGRSFTFDIPQRPALLFVYMAATVQFASALVTPVHRTFLPAGIAALALCSAALLVEPFLFAAIFLQLLASVGLAMLAAPETRAQRGPVRFLVYMTLGMPFVLLTGWLVEGSAISPGDPALVWRATLLLAAGFAILLGVVPFHTWMPQVAEESPPHATALVLSLVHGSATFLMLRFFNEFEWLRSNPDVYRALHVAGLALVVVGGLTGLVQRSLARWMGYAVMVDVGATLLAIGLGTSAGVSIALMTIASRTFGLAAWAVGLAHVRLARPGADGEALLRGAMWQRPAASVALVAGALSMVGVPLTVGFVGRWALIEQLAPISLSTTLALLAATAGLAVACARGLALLLERPDEDRERTDEPVQVRALALVVVAALFVLGLFPQLLMPAVARAVLSLGNLAGA